MERVFTLFPMINSLDFGELDENFSREEEGDGRRPELMGFEGEGWPLFKEDQGRSLAQIKFTHWGWKKTLNGSLLPPVNLLFFFCVLGWV